ncbi:MAG: hypothetical protein RQ745_09345 [Longimicrobiales bacterium]|nr:hypothetical protein [Longimicrobiales bacterium]
MEPIADVEARAAAAASSTRLERPTRIVFDWAAREVGGGRVSGAGVARAEPPDRARLDLFLDNNEAVARAALVGEELRLPPGMRDDLLPPLHFLWGTLGVFRPGVDQTLLGGEIVDGTVRIRYALSDDSEIHYHLTRSRVLRLERLRGGRVVQRMENSYAAEERIPNGVVYRDLATGRELTLTRTSLEHVESFPSDIWGD